MILRKEDEERGDCYSRLVLYGRERELRRKRKRGSGCSTAGKSIEGPAGPVSMLMVRPISAGRGSHQAWTATLDRNRKMQYLEEKKGGGSIKG